MSEACSLFSTVPPCPWLDLPRNGLGSDFSTPQVMELATSVLHNPVLIHVGTPNAGAAGIEQRLLYVGQEEGKLLAMRQLVQEGLRPPVLVFLQSKDRAKVCLRTQQHIRA